MVENKNVFKKFGVVNPHSWPELLCKNAIPLDSKGILEQRKELVGHF
jgi:hypothetical protein